MMSVLLLYLTQALPDLDSHKFPQLTSPFRRKTFSQEIRLVRIRIDVVELNDFLRPDYIESIEPACRSAC